MSGTLREALEQLWRQTTRKGDALDRLVAARDLRALLYDWEAELAAEAVEGGRSWEEVGSALGISRQAAWNRFRNDPAPGASIREARARLDQARARVRRTGP